jgi:predicted metal-binding protein
MTGFSSGAPAGADPIVITICITCRAAGADPGNAPGQELLAAVKAAGEGEADLLVRPTQCLGICKRVCTVSLSGTGKYTFLFGDLDPATDAPALVAMARACAAAEHGFVPWKERPPALRKGTIARIPPPGWSPEDGSAPA